MTPSRREFLAFSAAPWITASLSPRAGEILTSAVRSAGARSAASLASDEDFWFQVQNAFSVDRSIINFNNGGCCPSPTVAIESYKRHVDFSNHAPTKHMWGYLGPHLETTRERIARDIGCDPEELALTRNASESLEIVQFGLPLKAGDEVVTTNHDYPNMMNSWKQRAKRDGIVLKIAQYTPPATHDQLYELIVKQVTDKTRVIHISHITFTTGQIFPVRRICEFGRSRGIEVIVDGAHAYGQFTYKLPELKCDYYGVSLHKWMLAPIGVGILYVAKSKISNLWPLFGHPEPASADIRKFETYGTHPFAPKLAANEALVFQQTIGQERKSARLRYLREKWTSRVRGHENVLLYTSDAPETSAAIGTVGIRKNGELLDPGKIAEHLFTKHRIVTTPILLDEVKCLRITPNIYTTIEEVEMLATALANVASNGLNH
ncbi:MAG: aminotransferase class V-fold PLP-dependent enzyme [Planctomycetota bacterium]